MSNTIPFHKLRAAIVGGGRIGCGHDVFSHAAAYDAHPGFELAALIEPNAEARLAGKEMWKIDETYASLEEFLNAKPNVDVVSIATPVASHDVILRQLLNSNAVAVFCEKPFTGDIRKASNMVGLYRKAGKKLAVNYHRRWDPSMLALKSELAFGTWGAVQSVLCTYMKGLLQNGSHVLNLIEFFMGPLKPISVQKVQPGVEGDDTVDVCLQDSNGAVVHMAGLQTKPFFHFQIEILTQKGSITIRNAGLEMEKRTVISDPVFAGELALGEGETHRTLQDEAFVAAIDNIHSSITNNDKLNCSGEDALSTLQLCAEILKLSNRTFPNKDTGHT